MTSETHDVLNFNPSTNAGEVAGVQAFSWASNKPTEEEKYTTLHMGVIDWRQKYVDSLKVPHNANNANTHANNANTHANTSMSGRAGSINGNVTVCIRKRVLVVPDEIRNSADQQDEFVGALESPEMSLPMAEKTDVLTCANPLVFVHSLKERLGVVSKDLSSKPFRFHHVFDEDDNNDIVYNNCVRNVVEDLLVKGNSGTVIAYGQTGSGKTYTQNGMQERALLQILKGKASDQQLWLSCFENCGERSFDLLNERQLLQLRESGDGDIRVIGLTEVMVTNQEEGLRFIRQAQSQRATHPTANNPHSSRSHAICSLSLRPATEQHQVQQQVQQQVAQQQQLRIVDLAGSERTKDVRNHSAERIAEMKEINWSLGCLKECVRELLQWETSKALTDAADAADAVATDEVVDSADGRDLSKQIDRKASTSSKVIGKHIKFRNAKLTMILKSVLTGGQRCVIIGCISPAAAHLMHTRNTLEYCCSLRCWSELRAARGELATEEEVMEGLMDYYAQHCPERASFAACLALREKHRDKEVELFKILKKKYKEGPVVLTRVRPVAKDRLPPQKWSQQMVQDWLKKVDSGAYASYAPKFEGISGSALFCMDKMEIMRQCGAGHKCALFSEKLEEEMGMMTPEQRDRIASKEAEGETAGEAIYRLWYEVIQKSKKL